MGARGKMELNVEMCDLLLTSTRSVRKRLNMNKAVPKKLVEECLNIAVQAPSATNTQKWRFFVFSKAEKKNVISRYYKKSFSIYLSDAKKNRNVNTKSTNNAKIIESAKFLADNMEKVPLFLLFCVEGAIDKASLGQQASGYGSILPAAWSFMLAARSRGLGCCWTTLHLRYADQVAAELSIPKGLTQVALLPVAFYSGSSFKKAKRQPLETVVTWD